jgi:hypothetical protein
MGENASMSFIQSLSKRINRSAFLMVFLDKSSNTLFCCFSGDNLPHHSVTGIHFIPDFVKASTRQISLYRKKNRNYSASAFEC